MKPVLEIQNWILYLGGPLGQGLTMMDFLQNVIQIQCSPPNENEFLAGHTRSAGALDKMQIFEEEGLKMMCFVQVPPGEGAEHDAEWPP